MKEMSKEEFYEEIRSVIRGEITITKLAKKIKTDFRTLNNKIQELSVYNPELYNEYVEKFPYKSKSRDDIDFEALAIEIVKENMTMKTVEEKYNVGERTVRRRIETLKKENPYLYGIYKEVKENIKHSKKNSPELQSKIGDLVSRTVKVSELNEKRQKELEEIEAVFQNRCKYVSKKEAAKSMGMTANRIYKLLNELYRIRIEKENLTRKTTFKDTLKVNSSNPTIKESTTTEIKNKVQNQPGDE